MQPRLIGKALTSFRKNGIRGARAYGIRYAKNLIWKWIAYFDQRWTGALLLREGQSSGSFTVWPRSTKRLYLRNLKQGAYQIQVRHEDRWLAANRKSLIGYFRFMSGRATADSAREVGLVLGDNRKPFAYAGGGALRGGTFVQTLMINLPQSEPWVYVNLQMTADRLINIDSFTLLSNRVDLGRIDLLVASLVAKRPELKKANFLLYADINLNVVDGSSVWLSSMASILCSAGLCILLTKTSPRSDIVLSNIQNNENLIVLAPNDLGLNTSSLTIEVACEVLRGLDAQLPMIRNVVVRGLDTASKLLETRQFRERSLVYLTDFYAIDDGELTIPEERAAKAAVCLNQADTVLVQTPQIEQKLRGISHADFKVFELPPPIPDDLPKVTLQNERSGGVRIGYAGKITPNWGVDELLDWSAGLASTSLKPELHIVANKISAGASASGKNDFRGSILRKIGNADAIHHTDFNRSQSMKLMAEMDFVWCWRPPQLEDNTIELSTKLIEMAASGARCICYPSAINRAALGDDYPFFARDEADFLRIIERSATPSPSVAERLREKHGLHSITERAKSGALNLKSVSPSRRICLSGHDLKFINGYISRLKAIGHEVIHDDWHWGEPINVKQSEQIRDWAEIIFCEWGLANAVWQSHNKKPGQRLFIRAHSQEVRERARKFGRQINIENVEKVIFVSDNVREQALKLFNWPKEKTVVIPNFVLDDEYQFAERDWDGPIRLGMVGIIPQLKRFDHAVQTLFELRRRGHVSELRIKGRRPEELDYMRAPGRAAELSYYREVYDRIERDPLLRGCVHFDPWGNDVAIWYRKIEHILSCSDLESFHYALADGVLSGCHPLVWPWKEASELYTPDWIVDDPVAAADRIEAFRRMPQVDREAKLRENRALIVRRYGHTQIYQKLDDVIGL